MHTKKKKKKQTDKTNVFDKQFKFGKEKDNLFSSTLLV